MAIEWRPIEQLPLDRKDGRDLLLWDGRGGVVASWSNEGWETGQLSEETGNTLIAEAATHWADLNRPGDDPERCLNQEDVVKAMAREYNIKLERGSI